MKVVHFDSELPDPKNMDLKTLAIDKDGFFWQIQRNMKWNKLWTLEWVRYEPIKASKRLSETNSTPH